MRNLKHFFHFHRGEPHHRVVKILGSLFIGTALAVWASSQTLYAVKEQRIEALSRTVPEPVLSQAALLNVAQHYTGNTCTADMWHAALFDIKQLKKELATLSLHNTKLGDNAQTTHTLNGTLNRFEELITQAPTQDVSCEVLFNYWDAGLYSQVAQLRQRLELPKNINQALADVRATAALVYDSTIKTELVALGVSWSIVEGIHNFNTEIADEAYAYFKNNATDKAAANLHHLRSQTDPALMAQALQTLYKVHTATYAIEDSALRAQVDALLYPIARDINNVDFKNALQKVQPLYEHLEGLPPLTQRGATAQAVAQPLKNSSAQ